MVSVPNSEENRDLASAVTHRIRSDAMIVSAKSIWWWLIGSACIILSLGVGIGAAFFGYSYINDSRTSANKMAGAFADALKSVSLVVKLSPDSVVKMEPGVVSLQPGGTVAGTVKLDSGATVKLAPGATITGDWPRPSAPQFSGNGSSSGSYPFPNAKIVTNYTIFKSVPYGDNALVTSGWKFDNSEQNVPTDQYCYYIRSVENAGFEGTSVKQNLGSNGRFLASAANYKNFNGRDAARYCIWFDGQVTRF